MTALPFSSVGDTKTIAATTTTARVQLEGTGNVGDNGNILVTNSSDTLVFFKFGDSSVNATVTDMPILPGGALLVSKDGDYVAAITALGSSKDIYFTTGFGV